MRILHIDYHDDGSDTAWKGYMTPTSGYRLSTGMRKLGHTPVRIDYRHGRKGTFDESELSRCDLCWVRGQQIRWWDSAISDLRRVSRAMPVVISYCDMRLDVEEWLPVVAPFVSLLFHPCGGWRLRRFLDMGFSRCGFLPVGCFDPEEYMDRTDYPRDIPWFYSGTHTGFGDGCRDSDLGVLLEIHGDDVEHPGMFGQPPVGGRFHLHFVHRSQRGLSVSHYHAGWPKYTSSRTYQYMIAGVDTLVRWYPGCEEMLHPETPIYRDQDELSEMAREPRDDDRAQAMADWCRERYLGETMVQAALDMLDDEPTGQPWEETYVAG